VSAWPELDPAAYHGIAGRFSALFGPHTEADPIALLAQFLTGFGNAVGGSPHLFVDGARHQLNLFIVLVGKTAKSRKGTSEKRVRSVLEQADPDWVRNCNKGGVVSGEGIIFHLRDPIERAEALKQKGRHTGEFEVFVEDPGVSDKRLQIIESEFSALLKACERQANTSSETIRRTWDAETLCTLAKNSPMRASNPHVSIIGHITNDELRRTFTSTAQANGFGNRFIWFLVRRSKELPHSTNPDAREVSDLVTKTQAALEFARRGGQIELSAEARKIWSDIYHELSADRPGILGAITARAEAQVLRLAAVYATLDCSREIRGEHLIAAVALWTYSRQSAELIFKDALGDPDADAVLSALRSQPAGLSRTDINNLFARNLSAARIERALTTLLAHKLAEFSHEKTGGRPVERWRAVNKKTTKEI